MKYSKVRLEALGYELPPIVVSSAELEARLAPVYEALRIPQGQLEGLTGISERRWWPEGHQLSDGAIAAGRKALAQAGRRGEELEVLIFAGVNRENFEPATACRVAAGLGVAPHAAVYDLSNACLGMLNGMLDIANRIELGQIRCGMVVSCETARGIVEETIDRMLQHPTLEQFAASFATLTGGSGAAAVLLSRGDDGEGPRLLGGAAQAAPEHHGLCRWGLESLGGHALRQIMTTDAAPVLRHGVELGARTWAAFLAEMGWQTPQVDKVICHQVGQANQQAILAALGVPPEKDFTTFEYLGNMGTVSLPLTAALAAERQFLRQGDRVSWLGIGSGLNCMMLALAW